MKHVKNLIVGCGLSAAVLAERIASELKEEVFIIDKRDHVGGNIYDYKDRNGITVHRYGPHVFHTSDSKVWDYLSQFTKWHYFMYQVKAMIDGKIVNIPFNLNTIQEVFPKALANRLEEKLLEQFDFNTKVPILELRKIKDKELEFLANYIYDKTFLGYTTKQWGVRPEDIDESVTNRVPIYISRDNRYFQDKYQAIPLCGYTEMVRKILDNPLITIQLNTDFDSIKNDITYERLFYTGPIDEYFGYKFGELSYRSLRFEFVEYATEYYQLGPQINYSENYDFTRVVEYKYYLDEISSKTIISYEYPQEFERGKNERYYPVPKDINHEIYKKYNEEANKLSNVYFLGRLGDYKYYNMDQIVARALVLFEELKK
ncbi:UDP-galactopyranose mutase [Orbus sturtevantii]|uniref:UDP-galactopyranose mutase n=1 Tax=Orbus sturtevantii TaxID=3074109 RepID=UPI00370D855A